MLPKKRLPPMRRKMEKSEKNEEDNKIKEEEDNKIMEEFIANNNMGQTQYMNLPDNKNNEGGKNIPHPQKMNEGGEFEFPEFLRTANNEQYLQMFIRMRQRHNADGAVSLHVDADDIADQNLELYNNKGINIEPPLINENLADNVEYYIESVNRDEYYKIPKKVAEELDKEKDLEKPEERGRKNIDEKTGKGLTKSIEDVIKRPKKFSDLGRATEDELFVAFDLKLTEIINKTSNKVSLLFLFAQGLLAGVSLVNILLLFQYVNFSSFLTVYSYNVREIFNFTHFLTFGSLVGNGIKFISCYKRHKFIGSSYLQSESRSTIKKSMIFSGIILILFTIIFGILMYLASFVPLIVYSQYTTDTLLTETSFKLFATLYVVCNFIAILNFILNIFDVKVNEDNVNITDTYISDYDPEETRENSLVNF